VNYDKSLVVTITVTCYSWTPSTGDHLFTCGVIFKPPQEETCWVQHFTGNFTSSFAKTSNAI